MKAEIDRKELIGICALLVHAAKIDEKYDAEEKNLILSFIKKTNSRIKDPKEILDEGEKLENSSNQLLNFTNVIKLPFEIYPIYRLVKALGQAWDTFW